MDEETIKVPEKYKLFKLYDYNIYDEVPEEIMKKEDYNKYSDNKKFIIQMFGINKEGKTASITVNGFNPFFYIKVGDDWNEQKKSSFIYHIRKKIGSYYENSIVDSKLIKRHKLYIFDDKKLHNFIKITFNNTGSYNKVKKLFYDDIIIGSYFERKLKEEGYLYNDGENITNCYLYEGDIPPLLKLFHIKEIAPSGWIAIINSKSLNAKEKKTHCYYEYNTHIDNIKPKNKVEGIAKYKICSFDIEASSSHGDFPVAIKDYKKLATDILENYNNYKDSDNYIYNEITLKNEILSAFGYNNLNYINILYPKNKNLSEIQIDNLITNLINYIPANNKNKKTTIKNDEDEDDSDNNDDEEETTYIKKKKTIKKYNKKDANIIDLILDNDCDYATKLYELTEAFRHVGFPELEGDIITFIGLSFITYGEKNPDRRVIIVKGGCKIPDKYNNWVSENNVNIIQKHTEKDVLLTFTKIINSENPHIITGYNITGFDFKFMYERSLELNCRDEFLKLSKNKKEICISKKWNPKTKVNDENLETSKIVLASGEYDLIFPKMPGRIIMDMCVILRKEFQLSSFKLDYVSSYFISDNIDKIELIDNTTKIYSKNLTGINIGTFIKFEEVGFSNNAYKNGKKFEIVDINKSEKWFIINSYEELELDKYKFKWGLAKDDVTPQEIFDLANGDDYDRWTVGKYCLGDCDNVIWLLFKIDVITDKVEMSNLCNVPLSFLLLRGQGIKLQSYVSKKCGEKNTLMPTIQKNNNSDGYEGAHVFNPVTGLYLEEPVACVDYSSLYPSSIISENLSPDSKVWTKEYDLSDNLINEFGEKDENGNYIYDNLCNKGYKYVDVQFDTYKYERTTAKSAAKKVVKGYKICRYAQFPEGKAIMPSILEELLGARKSTRKLIPLQTDEFMKNILDKRQLSIKVTANSLYGQLGASTSAFYEPDVASCTTAIGRKLLFYGRSIIEECYNNINITMSDEVNIKVTAKCVYGDTDSVFFKFILINNDTGEKIINKQSLIYTIELAKQAGILASKFLKKPHDLEYEKTFWPFALLSKKRYVGILYEEDPEKGKMKYMGLVLKRRDNADIVKDIYGGVVNILMKEKSIKKSIEYVNNNIDELKNGKFKIDKLLVTKSLRGYYKNPKQIAHKVLAERIGLRDSGNKPSSGDRISYAYIKNNNKKALQGEKIETPLFIKENNLELDYNHYISNQIMKPLLQLFALELEKIKEFKNKRGITLQSWYSEINKLKEKWQDPEKFIKKYQELREKEVKSIIFDKYLK